MAKKLIETWEEYCEKHGIDPNNLPDVSMYKPEHQAAAIASYKLWLMAEDVNGVWKPNWKDTDERKWEPVFDMNDDSDPAGFSFSFTYCVYWDTYSTVGSRLCYETDEKAEHAGTAFLPLYRDLMVLPE